MAKPRPRKTKKRQQKQTNRKRKTVIFGIIMILLMILSLVSVLNYGGTGGTDLDYGEYEFELEPRANGGSVLTTEIGGQTVEFQNLPVQVQYLEVDPAAIDTLQSAQQIALVSDPNLDAQEAGTTDYARLQIGLAIPKTFNAHSVEHPDYTLPVLNCTHANTQMAVVMIEHTNETGIFSEGNCIRMQGQSQELTRLKDRLIFEYHGILQNGEVVE